MCGIFGIISDKNKTNKSYTNHLFRLSESRGKEAAGIAFWDNGSIDVLKSAQPVSTFLKSKQYKQFLNIHAGKNKFCAIGHSRLVTDGESFEHSNNQPVIANNLVGVHNGIIVNHEEIWREIPSIKRESRVDSEIFFKLYNLFLSKHDCSLLETVSETYKIIEGVASTATIVADLSTIILATNNGSIYYSSSPDLFVFASERYILEKFFLKNRMTKTENIQQLKSNHVTYLNIVTLKSTGLSFQSNTAEWGNKNFYPTRNIGVINDILKTKNKFRKSLKSKKGNLGFSNIKELELLYEKTTEAQSKLRRCSKCVLPETMPFIYFDNNGVCSYCHTHKKLEYQGEQQLLNSLNLDKENKDYDCILGISGGRDSTYALHYIKKEMELNPVVFTYDWGMVTDLARRNVSRICAKLGIEHILISADIKNKRNNIKKNVLAWLGRTHFEHLLSLL